ncbi:MAG: protein kinase [Waddliaceae bacterium]
MIFNNPILAIQPSIEIAFRNPLEHKITKSASEIFSAISDPAFNRDRLFYMCNVVSKVIEQYDGNKREIFPFKNQALQFAVDMDSNDMVLMRMDRETIKVIISSQKILGAGSYKKVWAAHCLFISSRAIKAYPIALTKTFDNEDDSETVIEGIRLERKFYEKTSSIQPSVFWDNENEYLYTEQERFDKTLMEISNFLRPKDFLPFFSKLALHIDKLHKENIVHCDIKNTNIFLRLKKGRSDVHIGDWDLAVNLSQLWDFDSMIGNEYPYWDSLRRNKFPLPTTDIFAFVICLAEIILGRPFQEQYWENPILEDLKKNNKLILRESLAQQNSMIDRIVVLFANNQLINIIRSDQQFFDYAKCLYENNYEEPGFSIYKFHAVLLRNYPKFYPTMSDLHSEIDTVLKFK